MQGIDGDDEPMAIGYQSWIDYFSVVLWNKKDNAYHLQIIEYQCNGIAKR